MSGCVCYNLRKWSVSADRAYQWSNSRRGHWRIAGSPVLKCSITNERLAAGYFSTLNYYELLHVSYKDIKALMADLRSVYAAVDEPAALDALDAFSAKWDTKYPKISRSWRENWANLSTYFKYPQEVRRLIYTTNAIEGFNRQLRKITKTRSVFPTDDSLFKMLYLAMVNITKKWTGRQRDWSVIHAQLSIYFDERMPE